VDVSSSASKAGHGVSGTLDSAGRSIKGAAHEVGSKVSHAADKVGCGPGCVVVPGRWCVDTCALAGGLAVGRQ
jgi:hypothetical protein